MAKKEFPAIPPKRLEGKPPRYESPLKRQKLMPDLEDNEALNGEESDDGDDLLFEWLQGVITQIILSALATGSGIQDALKLANCRFGITLKAYYQNKTFCNYSGGEYRPEQQN